MRYYFKKSNKMIKLGKLTCFLYHNYNHQLIYQQKNNDERKSIEITKNEYDEFVKKYLEINDVIIITDKSGEEMKGGLSLNG